MGKSFIWPSLSSISLPDLLEVPRNKLRTNIPNLPSIPNSSHIRHAARSHPHGRSHLSQNSLLSKFDSLTSHPSVHPVWGMAMKVFLLSIIYHLVEEKTSKSITGFRFSWFITLMELLSAFILEFFERLSIKIHISNECKPEISGSASPSILTPNSSMSSLQSLIPKSPKSAKTNNTPINNNPNNTIIPLKQPSLTRITPINNDITININSESNQISDNNTINNSTKNKDKNSDQFEEDDIDFNNSNSSNSDNYSESDSNSNSNSDSDDDNSRLLKRYGTDSKLRKWSLKQSHFRKKSDSFINLLYSCIPRDKYPISYILLATNLILSRGLSTVVLQYYDMDYPTYAICRNSKMVFVMFLSVFWLKKSYHLSDWTLVVLTSISVFCFRVASHDLWFSSVNILGVPILLVAIFLSAMDNSWKEKVMKQRHDATPNEILFHINFIAVLLLFVITLVSGELYHAIQFLIQYPSTISWMLLRGLSYSFWIHFSVVLIQQAGALLNQYVSAGRKLFSVVLSFLIFGKPFYFMHGMGFVFFATACVLKVYLAHKKQSAHVTTHNKQSFSSNNSKQKSNLRSNLNLNLNLNSSIQSINLSKISGINLPRISKDHESEESYDIENDNNNNINKNNNDNKIEQIITNKDTLSNSESSFSNSNSNVVSVTNRKNCNYNFNPNKPKPKSKSKNNHKNTNINFNINRTNNTSDGASHSESNSDNYKHNNNNNNKYHRNRKRNKINDRKTINLISQNIDQSPSPPSSSSNSNSIELEYDTNPSIHDDIDLETLSGSSNGSNNNKIQIPNNNANTTKIFQNNIVRVLTR